MTHLTVWMRAALDDARRNDGFRLVHDDKPGRPRPPWPWPTIHALERREFVDHADLRDAAGGRYEKWTITDAGRLALDPPPQTVRRDSHNSMRAKGAATTRVCIGGVWTSQRFPEPEKVTRLAQDDITKKARERDRKRHQLEVQDRQQARQSLDAETRLVEVQRQAKMRHIDVSGEVHVLRKMIERAKKGGRQQPAAAVTRLERIERRLDDRPDLAA
jgi:hypothetical protein